MKTNRNLLMLNLMRRQSQSSLNQVQVLKVKVNLKYKRRAHKKFNLRREYKKLNLYRAHKKKANLKGA